MIYFFQSVDGGTVKIGTTENLQVRWKQLEAHYGCPLALLATMPGGKPEEADVHAKFARIRFGRSEQFQPTAELMTFIGRPLLASEHPECANTMAKTFTDIVLQFPEPVYRQLFDIAKKECNPIASFIRMAVARELKAKGV